MAEKNAATCRRLSEMVLRSQKPLNIFVSTVLVVNENLFTLKDFSRKQKLSRKRFRLFELRRSASSWCTSCLLRPHTRSESPACAAANQMFAFAKLFRKQNFPSSSPVIGKASCHPLGQCMQLNFYIIGERKHVI